MNAVPHLAAVDLQLGLTGPAPPDSAGQPGKAAVSGREPGQQVFHLGQLDLEFSFPAVGPLGKDVQDQLGPVNDPELGEVGDGAHLAGIQLLVEDQKVRPPLEGPDGQVHQLFSTHEKTGMKLMASLADLIQNDDAGCVGQVRQLVQRILDDRPGSGRGVNQNRPVPMVPRFPSLPASGELILQGLDQLQAVHLQLGHRQRIPTAPILPFIVQGDEVRQVDIPGQAGLQHLDGSHQVQPQHRQVRQVVMGQ